MIQTSNFKKAKEDFDGYEFISIARVDPKDFEPHKCLKELAPSGTLLMWYKSKMAFSKTSRTQLWEEYTRKFKLEMLSNERSMIAIYALASKVASGGKIVLLCHCDHNFQETRCHRHIVARAVNRLVKEMQDGK